MSPTPFVSAAPPSPASGTPQAPAAGRAAHTARGADSGRGGRLFGRLLVYAVAGAGVALAALVGAALFGLGG